MSVAAIQQTLDLLCPDAQVEIRVLLEKSIIPRRFQDHTIAAVEANSFPTARAIYAVLNPFDESKITGQAVNDASITRRRWLLIDIDPTRPADTNASREELALACSVGDAVRTYLTSQEWPDPVECMSGNGPHLLYSIDLPNDADSESLIKDTLRYLAETFDTPAAHVDVAVANASRITKLYGTMARKGPHTDERPHRLSLIGRIPSPLGCVSRALLAHVAALASPVSVPLPSGLTEAQYNISRILARLEVFSTLTHEKLIRYNVRCPWESEHTTDTQGTIFTVAPDGAVGFKCLHSHCKERKWPQLRDRLGIETEVKRLQPSLVRIQAGKITEITDASERALLQTGKIYQRGGVLTRAIKLDQATHSEKDVRRDLGSTVLIEVIEAWLTEQMGLTLIWQKYNERKKDYVVCDPPFLYAKTLLGRGEWRFPVLRGVVTAPTLTRDGRIIEHSGFDASSGFLLDFSEDSFPPLPLHPSQEDAKEALKLLERPMRSFPFIDQAAKAVALSAVLTALIRLSLRTAPLHAFDAPTAGTGKSLLAEMAGLVATGTRPPAMSQGKTDEEDEKRLSTVLFAGDPVIHIDNCERPITGDFLCSMLTQEIVQARILGASERRILPSTALILASGNNLVFAGDTTRRAVVSRLDAKVDRPDSRAFDFDCHQEVLANRAELVIAGLTILLAYHQAGRPSEKLLPMGSYKDWEWVRGALVWVGCADPADTRINIVENDPRKDELLTVFRLWESIFGFDPVEVEEINTLDSARLLKDKLIEIACHGSWNGKAIGWWLRRNKDRMAENRCLRCERHERGNRWWLSLEGSGKQEELS